MRDVLAKFRSGGVETAARLGFARQPSGKALSDRHGFVASLDDMKIQRRIAVLAKTVVVALASPDILRSPFRR